MPTSPRVLLLAASLCAAALCRSAPCQQQDRLLVCNKAEATVSIFDVATRRELVALPTGAGPHEVAVSRDGRTAAVSDYGERAAGHSLTIVDVVAGKVLCTVDLVRAADAEADTDTSKRYYLRPHGVCFVDDRRVLVTSERSRRLVLVDVVEGRIVRDWPTSQPSMHMVAWVANRAANTLTVVAAKTGKPTATLDTGALPFRVAFTADARYAMVTCAEGGQLQFFDAKAKEKKLQFEVSIAGDRSEQSSLPLGVVADPDARFAYVTCARGEFVAVIDIAKHELVDRIDARKGPDGIAYARPASKR